MSTSAMTRGTALSVSADSRRIVAVADGDWRVGACGGARAQLAHVGGAAAVATPTGRLRVQNGGGSRLVARPSAFAPSARAT